MYENVNELIENLKSSSAKEYEYARKLMKNDGNGHLNHLENGIRIAKLKYRSWFKGKKSALVKSDKTGINSMLGELGAVGNIDSVFPRSLTPQMGDGADFKALIGRKDVLIEVNTPLLSCKSVVAQYEDNSNNPIKISEKEICPFGRPSVSKKGVTANVQGEAVSKIASIKQDEHQFEKNKINILYVDFIDPGSNPFKRMMDEQISPLACGNQGEFVSGAIWWAFFGKKGDPIYDGLNKDWGYDEPYKMEFNGRFNQSSIIDIVIIALANKTVLFQNPQRKVPSDLLIDCTSLNNFSMSESYMDIGLTDLKRQIRRTRRNALKIIKKINNRKKK